MYRRNAFTLIELLVVVAIIAILAAILFPVFAMAKTSAKKVVSLSNMRQIGLATTMYVNDYNDVSPPLYYYDANNLSLPTTEGFYYWGVLLLPYTKNEAVQLCPMDTADDPALADANGRGRFDPLNLRHHYIIGANPSYGYNYRYQNTTVQGQDPNGTNPTPFYYVGANLSAIDKPAQTIAFAEATMKDKTIPSSAPNTPPVTVKSPIGYARIEPPTRWVGSWPDARSYGQLWPRFNPNLVNVVWLDGHVKSRSMKSIRGIGDTAESIDRLYNGQGD